MYKTCSSCKLEQSTDEFSKNGVSRKGTPLTRSSCKSCEKARLVTSRNSDPLYNSKQAQSRRIRLEKRREVEAYRKKLTFQVDCSSCKKPFLVTVLPEKPGNIKLVCEACTSQGESNASN